MREYVQSAIRDPRRIVSESNSEIKKIREKISRTEILIGHLKDILQANSDGSFNSTDFPDAAFVASQRGMTLIELLEFTYFVTEIEAFHSHIEYRLLNIICGDFDTRKRFIHALFESSDKESVLKLIDDDLLRKKAEKREKEWLQYRLATISQAKQEQIKKLFADYANPLQHLIAELSALKIEMAETYTQAKQAAEAFEEDFAAFALSNKFSYLKFKECAAQLMKEVNYFSEEDLMQLVIERPKDFSSFFHYATGCLEAKECMQCLRLTSEETVFPYLRHAIPTHFRVNPPEFLETIKNQMPEVWPWGLVPENQKTLAIEILLAEEGFGITLERFVFSSVLNEDLSDLTSQEMRNGVANNIDAENLHKLLALNDYEIQSFMEDNQTRAKLDGVNELYFTQFISNIQNEEISRIFLSALRERRSIR